MCVLYLLIQHQKDEYLYDRAYAHLTAREPTHFWTSGQWMTERKGGSDVGTFIDTYTHTHKHTYTHTYL